MNNLLITPVVIPLLTGMVLIIFQKNIQLQKVLSLAALLATGVVSVLLINQIRNDGIQTLQPGRLGSAVWHQLRWRHVQRFAAARYLGGLGRLSALRLSVDWPKTGEALFLSAGFVFGHGGQWLVFNGRLV